MAIPVSVLILTRNEEKRIGHCLAGLRDFAEIIVVDSQSTDRTVEIAREAGAKVVNFSWNGQYPKKKQWTLEQVATAHPWVLFIDADEVPTAELVGEIRQLFESGRPPCAGYFIKGRYVVGGKALRFGAQNFKLALLDKRKWAFPVLDDLDLPLGEIEGHYQPVLKTKNALARIGRLKAPLYHYALESEGMWRDNHRRYALWEAGMNSRQGWPVDPVWWRQGLKRCFRALSWGRGVVAFFHCYAAKGGFLDGRAGLYLALRRYRYYRMVEKARSL